MSKISAYLLFTFYYDKLVYGKALQYLQGSRGTETLHLLLLAENTSTKNYITKVTRNTSFGVQQQIRQTAYLPKVGPP